MKTKRKVLGNKITNEREDRTPDHRNTKAYETTMNNRKLTNSLSQKKHKFLEVYNLPKLNQKDKKNLNE